MITGASCQKSGDLEISDLKINLKIYIIRNRKYHSLWERLDFGFNILFSAETLLFMRRGVSISEIRYPVAAVWERYKWAPRRESALKKLQCRSPVLLRDSQQVLRHQESGRLRLAIPHTSALPSVRRGTRSRIKSWFRADTLKHRSCQTWWIFCFFACCLDCTASLVKVSKNTGCTPTFPIFFLTSIFFQALFFHIDV